MAIDRTGISSLNAGAGEITYSGNEGPKSPQQMAEFELIEYMEEFEKVFPEMKSLRGTEGYMQSLNEYFRGLTKQESREGIQMASAEDPILKDEYDRYVFELKEIRPEATPMTIEEFRQQAISGMAEGGIARLGYKDGYSVQGGVKNYLGNQKTVSNVPVKWQSGPDKPETELAYITKAEKDLILKKDLHGSLQDGPNMGPGGLMSLDSWGDVAGGQAGADVSDSGGGRGGDPSTTYSYDPVAAARAQALAVEEENRRIQQSQRIANEIAAAKLEKQKPPGGGDSEMYYMDTGGADITVPGDEQYQTISSIPIGDYEDDKILRISEGVEPGYRAQDERPFGLSKEEAFRQGKITEDQYKYSEPVLTLDRGLDTGTTGLGDTGGIGTGGTGINVPATPIVPEGITAAESAQAFEDAKAAEIAKVQAAAAASGAPFKDYYVGGSPTAEQEKFMQEQKAAASMVGRESWPAAYGGRVPAAFGGIMDSATGRRAYGLGSVFKSITKPFKKAAKAIGKVAKSPIGMAALTAFGLPALAKTGIFGTGIKDMGWKKFLGEKILGTAIRTKHPMEGVIEGDRVGGLLNMIKDNPMYAIAGASAIPFLTQGEEEGTDFANMDYGPKLDLLGIRKKILAKQATQEQFPYLNPDQYAVAADGGRIGYANGGNGGGGDPIAEIVALMRKRMLGGLTLEETDRLDELIKDTGFMEQKAQGGRIGFKNGSSDYIDFLKDKKDGIISPDTTFNEWLDDNAPDPDHDLIYADGGRIGYQDGRSVRSLALNQLYGIAPKRKFAQEGGLMDLGGMEKDYREEGGFVPIGGQERADDVPARLSKNEFVFTADAVRAAGGGDIDKGAEVMENVMNNLEQGGQVSEDSQGLEGARNMFATAQRLEGVL